MQIGQLSKKSGIPSSTLRYYESIGLLQSRRKENGYRTYPIESLQFLAMIEQAKSLGFTLSEIKEMAYLIQYIGQEEGTLRTKLEQKLEQIDQRINTMKTLKANILQLLNANCPL